MPASNALASAVIDDVLAAMSDPTRRHLLDQIAARGYATATVLAESTEISRQGVMKHLGVLERAGLVSSKKEGREVLFFIRSGRLSATARWMDNLARQWDRRLQLIKHIAESE
ncbi:MAG: metalloregulator ArsR/SmtB family transcription factor [Thermomicrobiales bacterium]